MNIKDLKENKNFIDITIALDDEDIKKIGNTVYLLDLTSLDPIYSKNINKDLYEQYFNMDETVSRYQMAILNKIKNYIQDNTEYEFFIQPTLEVKELEKFSSEEPIKFQAVLEPEIELINYKEDLTYPGFVVDENELNKALDNEVNALIKHNVRLEPTEKPFEEGNTISADYKLEFNGQTVEDEKNKIISTDDMPQFLNIENLIGKSIGDEVFQNDNDYFKIRLKINQIYTPEYPELDDDFASEISEFDTLDELKDDLKEKITEGMKQGYEEVQRENALRDFIKGTILKDSGEELENYKNSDNFNDLVDRLSLNNYVSRWNLLNLPEIEKEFDYQLISLIIEKLLEKENIDLSEDIDKVTKEYVKEGTLPSNIPAETQNYFNTINQYRDSEIFEGLVKAIIKDILNYQKALEIIEENIKEEEKVEE